MSTLQLGPILRALKRSRLSAGLIIAQIALTLAIIANMTPVVVEKVRLAIRASGVAEESLVAVTAFSSQASDALTQEDVGQRTARELPIILGTSGVANATYSNTYPNSQSGWSTSIKAQGVTGTHNAAMYFADERALDTLGFKLLEGRFFGPLEIKNHSAVDRVDPPVVVLTKSMAERFFPDGSGLGKRVAVDDESEEFNAEIIGIVSDVARPWVGWGRYYDSMFIPLRPLGFGRWIVQVKPGNDPDEVGRAVQAALAKADRSTIYGTEVTSLVKARKLAYADSVLIAALLAFFSIFVLVVTLLGIVGLTSFWITQRTRQIGVRRALGATSAEILSYFRQENFLLSAMGCTVGAVLAYGLNFLLSKYLSADVLSWTWLLAAVVLMLVIGQIAIWAPAARAARIAPALATRA